MTKEESMLPLYEGDLATELEKWKLSRRNFLMMAGFGGLGALGGLKAFGTLTGKTPIMSDAKGVLFHRTERCVGCTRCEKACTEFNDGASSWALARIKVNPNLVFGPSGAAVNGYYWGQGSLGNGKVVAETCKQCPHPVPCAEACPAGAIYADATTGARVIDSTKCIGCGICTKACPWAMPVLNTTTHKATKCFLCNGKPECVHACPTGALQYVAWRDLRANTPVIQSGIMPASTTTNCSTCHS
jgi:Fe-S-cluster-containing dehydrogenase component